jgi:hypothetical protein
MRFLFGLMLGAGLTLFVATVFNVPTQGLIEKSKTSWDDFLLATGNALFEFPTMPDTPPQTTVAELSDALEEFTMQGLEVDENVHPDKDVPLPPPLAAAPITPPDEPADLEVLLDDVAQLELEQPATDPEPTTTTDLHPATQSVWVPFRSQMSAEGFAKRLTGKLEHPFSVSREGPGRYQVMFSYSSELERLALLDQVQTLTGQGAL